MSDASPAQVLVVSGGDADRLAAERLVEGRYVVKSIGDVAALERFPGKSTIVVWWSSGADSAVAMEALGERLDGGTKTVKYLTAPSPTDTLEGGIANWGAFLPYAKPLIKPWSNGSFRAAVAEFEGAPVLTGRQAPAPPTEPPDAPSTGSPDEPAAEEFLASLVTLDASIPEQEPADLQPEVPAYERSIVFAAVQREGWGVPLDFWGGSASTPEVQEEWLPPAIFPYGADQCARRGVDLAQFAIAGPTVLAALIRQSIYLQMMPDDPGGWKERAILWGCIQGDPSTRKSIGIEIADGHLRHLASSLRATEERNKVEYGHALKVYESQLADYYRKAKTDPGAQRPEAPERPQSTRLWVDDATKEAVALLCSNHARGKVPLILKDELAGWWGSMGAYAQSGSAEKDRADWLSFYESKEKYIDRAKDGGTAIHCPTWAGGILGGVQPSILQAQMAKMGGDGMMQRFMVATSRPATRGEQRAPDTAATTRWQSLCANLLEMEPHPHGPTRLSPGAQELREDFAQWLDQIIRAGFTPGLQFAAGKWEGLWGRLALVSHCCAAADAGKHFPDERVSLDTAEQVTAYIKHFIFPNALHLYEVSLADSAQSPLKRVAGDILTTLAGSARITRSDISHAWSPGWRKLAETVKRDTITALCEAGWMRADGMTYFLVNPAVHGRFKEVAQSLRAEKSAQASLMPEKMPNKFAERSPGEED